MHNIKIFRNDCWNETLRFCYVRDCIGIYITYDEKASTASKTWKKPPLDDWIFEAGVLIMRTAISPQQVRELGFVGTTLWTDFLKAVIGIWQYHYADDTSVYFWMLEMEENQFLSGTRLIDKRCQQLKTRCK